MPGKTLPSFTEAEVRSHNSSKSCYVTIDSKVYDVTDFLEGHPAGEEVILEWAGKDIKNILEVILKRSRYFQEVKPRHVSR